MEVSKIETFLTVAGRNLDRNFTFRITNPLNSTQKAASVSIKRAYQQANDIRISVGDKLYLSMAVNGGGKVLLFSGTVSSVGESSAYYRAEALFSALKAEALNETYRGISYKEAFAKLADKLDYQAEDASPEQIILQGSPSESFNRLINSLAKALKKPVYYYLKGDDTLVITTEIGGGAEYTIDNMLLSSGAEALRMFPIPELEIGDTLQWGGHKKTVLGLVWNTGGRAEMVSNVMEYSPPKPKEEPKVQAEKPAERKPDLEEEKYFTNTQVFESLTDEFKPYLIQLAKSVKAEMPDYKRIPITSAVRTYQEETDILLGKMVLKGEGNMYLYYLEQNATNSTRFLKVIQYLYDGNYPNQIVPEEDYDAIKEVYKEISTEKFRKFVNQCNVQKNDYPGAKKLLELSYRDGRLFQPSHHVAEGVDARSYSVDLSYTEEALALLEKHQANKGGGYERSPEQVKEKGGEIHVHINYIFNSPKK